MKTTSRRRFLKQAAALGAAPLIIPGSALGLNGAVAPSNRIAMGFIGLGGKGTGGLANFMRCKEAQPVAVCDVEKTARDNALQRTQLPPEAAYLDFRDLIVRDDVDAVLVATPDHWHALITIAAANAGKHVYCEKPLSNTIEEGRAVVDAVKRAGVVFQHGTQLRSFGNIRYVCELVRNHCIGELQSVTIGSPPGLAVGQQPLMDPPATLDYDRWLGPAPYKPYTTRRVKAPGELPGWYFVSDYSKAGWVAGYGVHDLDIAHWGMDTEHTGPIAVEGEGVFPRDGLFDTVLTFDLAFEYANGITITMTDTGKNPHGVRFNGREGWIHTRGAITCEPASLAKAFVGPNDVHLYKSDFHERNFLECIRTRRETITPVEVAHRSTSAALIGGIALKLGRRLEWDPAKERFVNDPEADRLLSYPMRAPWRL